MHDCFFCTIRYDKSRTAWEDQLFYMIYDTSPVSPGHALIIPKRHVRDFAELNEREWRGVNTDIRNTISLIEQTDFIPIYQEFIKKNVAEQSVWFCQKALNNPRINTKPDAYNHGLNDGKAAGRTVDHFHWHIIPRYDGDMVDPRGGVRYVIPEMGNYNIHRG